MIKWSVSKHAFTDESWKKYGTLMISTPLFRKVNFTLLIDAFVLALSIVGFNALDLIISRASAYHWKFIEFLSSAR